MTRIARSPSTWIEDLLRLRAGREHLFSNEVAWPDTQYRRGLVVAQSLIAAGHTVDTALRWVQAVHATHIGEVDPALRVEYHVECVTESGQTSTRLIRACQGAVKLAVTRVSFQAMGSGHAPRAGEPEEWPDPHRLACSGGIADLLEVRDLAPERSGGIRSWVRYREELPDQRQIHAAAVVVFADLLLARAGVPDAGQCTSSPPLSAASIDMSVRLHSGFRADDWIRHRCFAIVADEERTHVTGRFSSPQGRLFATVSHERLSLPAGHIARASHGAAAAALGPQEGVAR